jgi:hypothetical protein
MRLTGIRTNDFLERYLSGYNERFAVQPMHPGDLHQPAGSEARRHRLVCL